MISTLNIGDAPAKEDPALIKSLEAHLNTVPKFKPRVQRNDAVVNGPGHPNKTIEVDGLFSMMELPVELRLKVRSLLSLAKKRRSRDFLQWDVCSWHVST